MPTRSQSTHQRSTRNLLLLAVLTPFPFSSVVPKGSPDQVTDDEFLAQEKLRTHAQTNTAAVEKLQIGPGDSGLQKGR